ncbi:hemerythrin domain-containing protein [Alteribacillus iranensis]|uniref:Hemerythrin HHE cation binding domain-containing protein n=1 Tax=Alteribacillus iranensis TaxID=930128 RepID=A0A1I2E680_9BACI|nr:hemerythrin domain-containing protein [Alteribacillus iranensis]SFE88193.1 Hemerythrin HHE cation binding domain-containing protein [Alteribacillus iranensis]
MSGPALRVYDSHRSIHEAAFGQVKEMTAIIKQLYNENRWEEAKQAEEILIEHWYDHIIAHADSEETGLYQDIKQRQPEMVETIAKLTRDHDLLRKVLEEAKHLLEDNSEQEERIQLYDSLLVINWQHSRDEEKYLLL